MKAIIVVVAFTAALGACSTASQQAIVADADCGPQAGMTGDLSTDIIGTWRSSWTGPADGGPSSLLFEFRPDGTATTVGWESGPEQWSYRVVGDEVWMTGADPGDDLQSLRTTWIFDGGTWSIVVVEPYGDSTLAWCTSS